MIKIDNIRIDISKGISLSSKVSSIISKTIPEKDIIILKKSIDSRRKNEIKIVYSVVVATDKENKILARNKDCSKFIIRDYSLDYTLEGIDFKSHNLSRPVIVGSGPAGLFCALSLAKKGLKPIIIERGSEIEKRTKDVLRFEKEALLNTNSNVQFGEGGAGTFSDGKLNTGVGGDIIKTVLCEFVNHGAPKEIQYESKPHIGTDKLLNVVKTIRNKIIELGGEVYFDTKFSDVIVKNNEIKAVVLEGAHSGTLDTNILVLATGHSARDTFEMLLGRGFDIEQKPFSVGIRVEHLQSEISKAQYGEQSVLLPPADYKLSNRLDNNRGCYTFCMCPGGYVMCASSEEGGVVTNGMSRYQRDGVNANSAVLVNVLPSDFESNHPLAGVEYQRKLERKAFELAGKTYKAPASLYGDFKKRTVSSSAKEVKPTYAIGVEYVDFHDLLPKNIAESILISMSEFGKKIQGFDKESTIMEGIESRSSSPIRILRDEKGESNVKGVYPAGEGAGYAGGITSAAADGIRCAINILTR